MIIIPNLVMMKGPGGCPALDQTEVIAFGAMERMQRLHKLGDSEEK